MRRIRQTHCKRGHLLEGENIRLVNGTRVCRLCHRIWKREYLDRMSDTDRAKERARVRENARKYRATKAGRRAMAVADERYKKSARGRSKRREWLSSEKGRAWYRRGCLQLPASTPQEIYELFEKFNQLKKELVK